MLLKGAENVRYESLKETLVTSYLVKQDQYPRTIQDMVDTLSKHKFDDAYYARQEKYKQDKRKKGGNRKKNNDNEEDDTEDDVNLAQFGKTKKYQCYKCGGTDHALKSCPKGNIPRSEYWINLSLIHI